MTVQERIDSGLIRDRFKDGQWREGTVQELEHDYPFLKGYVQNINWWGRNTRVAILKDIEHEKVYHLYLYSNKYEYAIHIRPTYIGAYLSCRAHEPLEDWTRGRDLPDGKCTEETFKRCLYAILSCELIPYDDGSKKPYWATEEAKNGKNGCCVGGISIKRRKGFCEIVKGNKFVDKTIKNIADRLKEVYGETLPRELDNELAYIVSQTYQATERLINDCKEEEA